ncbi:MbnP family protein [Hymenobacter siberiensis]|uniref:MbnP family protein n=1 Tax=Hymenobacter siberiensis TaxID=2848396 RepID=UPI001C1DE0B8|nr:MbnP family protein [Hymenobacter siberiensis]
MKRFSISALFCTLTLATLALAGCKKDEVVAAPPTVSLEFEQTVGADLLVLDTKTYTTLAGDQFRISIFRQYISNIVFTKTDGSTYAVPDSYYLLDAAKPDSRHLTLTGVPAGDYKGITFTIGVDSVHNVSGVQKGALDPNNNMFWTWNSGYIFTKLEGYSAQSTTSALTFHIGGFKAPNNTIRTVSPAFPSGMTLLVRADHSPEIHLNVDLLKLFSGPSTIRFATLSDVQSPGSNAVKVANNYAAGMYSVEHIHAN